MDVQTLSLMRPEHRGAASTPNGLPNEAAKSPKRGGLQPYETLKEWEARWFLRVARKDLVAAQAAEEKAFEAFEAEPTVEEQKELDDLSDKLADAAKKADSEAKRLAYDTNNDTIEEDGLESRKDEVKSLENAVKALQADVNAHAVTKWSKAVSSHKNAEEAVKAAKRQLEKCDVAARAARASYKARLQRLGVSS